MVLRADRIPRFECLSATILSVPWNARLFHTEAMTSAQKIRYPRAAAIAVAKEICLVLAPACTRLCVAGSLRRMKPEVGDVEVVYVPRLETAALPGELFAFSRQNLAEFAIADLLNRRIIEKRIGRNESSAWGNRNKLAVHRESGIPVDLFCTSEAAWANYIVCRTGPKESNERIATAARAMGWQWNPYDTGFTNLTTGERHQTTSEQDVFEFVGLPHHEPCDR